MKRLVEILERMKAIQVEMKSADKENLETLEAEVDDLIVEKKALEERQNKINSKFEEGQKINVIGPEGDGEKTLRKENTYESLEYREAFKDYVLTGEKEALKRADATTVTSDVGSVVPTTILNKIVEEMKDYGDIYPLITKTNYPGGLDIPTSSAKPTASWIAEGSVADKQKKATSKISFNYYKLQIVVAISLMADTVSLPVFEQTVSDNIAEAMVVAIEEAVLNGTGSGQPLGITADTGIPAEQVVEFADTDADYTGWLTKLIGNIPIAYRKAKKSRIVMNPATFDNYIWGLKDDRGQPIARTTYGVDGEIVYRFLGYPIVLRNEIAPLNASTAAETVVAAYVDFSNYTFNTNLQINLRRYFDENTDEWIQKSTMIADGKLADKNGVVLLKTAAV
jgi:HK97 family phage major capsid protein